MKESILKGTSFGITSGIITTLGLMVGLYSGTNSKMVVLGGILTIAIADSFSDALGIHISEEAENKHTEKQIWVATIFTFISKFLMASFFLIPVLLFQLKTAILVSIFIGLLLISVLSYKLAKMQKIKAINVIFEHLIVAILVIFLTYITGLFISEYFTNTI
jgi:vacuolar iron transporter family protein